MVPPEIEQNKNKRSTIARDSAPVVLTQAQTEKEDPASWMLVGVSDTEA
jgi:hypothetical protein